jgi:hypothetical protein
MNHKRPPFVLDLKEGFQTEFTMAPSKPLDPKKEPIMRDGRTFTEWADELGRKLVEALNTQTKKKAREEEPENPEFDKELARLNKELKDQGE